MSTIHPHLTALCIALGVLLVLVWVAVSAAVDRVRRQI